MKTYLIPNTKQYKANLHCHTVLSDGQKTPEQIKDEYKAKGYSIVAFTDHEYIVNHQHLNDENFIAITAYEANFDSGIDWRYGKCAHLNFYAKNPYEDMHVVFHPDNVNQYKLALPVRDKLKWHGEKMYKKYELIQYAIDEANKHGYLVCLNHPYWSLQKHEDYFNFKGLCAMEVYNNGCGLIGGHAWLDYGLFCCENPDENVAPIAADDTHNPNDEFGGYTMICTDDFSYGGIIKAMEERNFYASTGIQITEFSVEDGKCHVECSGCTDAGISQAGRIYQNISNPDGMTSFDFDIRDGAKYVRIILQDKRTGGMAATKPYYLK